MNKYIIGLYVLGVLNDFVHFSNLDYIKGREASISTGIASLIAAILWPTGVIVRTLVAITGFRRV